MVQSLTVAPAAGHRTFLYARLVERLDDLSAHNAFLGIPYGNAYDYHAIVNDQANAPAAMRRASDRLIRSIERYDFDLGGPLYDGKAIDVVDCGDVRAEPGDTVGHLKRAEQVVRRILAAGAMPIVLGGDHGIPIPVLRAFEGQGPITLVQIDQHIDWRDEVNGVREGLSSPIRRASEMPHIGEIFQIGLRATGSAHTEEVEAARAYGAHLRCRLVLHHAGHGRHGSVGCTSGRRPMSRRRHVRASAQADPRPGEERPRGRHGRGRDHAEYRRQPDHLHYRWPADRQPDRHGSARRYSA